MRKKIKIHLKKMWTFQSQHEGLELEFSSTAWWCLYQTWGRSELALFVSCSRWTLTCYLHCERQNVLPHPMPRTKRRWNTKLMENPDTRGARQRQKKSQKQMYSEGFTALCGLTTFCSKPLQKWLQPYMWVWSLWSLRTSQTHNTYEDVCVLFAFLLSDSLQSTYLTWMNNLRRLWTVGWFEY